MQVNQTLEKADPQGSGTWESQGAAGRGKRTWTPGELPAVWEEETLWTACVLPWLQTYSAKTSNNKTTWTQMVTFYYRKSIPNIGFYKHWQVNKYNFKHKYKVKRQNVPAFCFLEKCHVLLQRWSHQSTNVTPSPVEAWFTFSTMPSRTVSKRWQGVA